jgi:hypothetical protein
LAKSVLESKNERRVRDHLRRNEKLSDDDVELIRTLVRHEDQIAHEVYFASGAFEEKKQRRSTDGNDSHQQMTSAEVCRFAREAKELLEVVCASKFSNVAYTVLQTLQHLRRADPPRVFLLVGKLVRAATADSFQFESLAADRVVEIVEQYLAEDRGLFRGDTEVLQTLMDMLDLFVAAGWPKAIALTYRLDEFFR